MWDRLCLTAAAFSIIASAAAGASFQVTTLSESGPGSLRQAMLGANATANSSADTPDRIIFAIPGTGVRTIAPLTQLPAITDAVIIDGYTQPGARENTLPIGNNAKLMIQISGKRITQGSAAGLDIESSNCLIRGLILNGFTTFEGTGIAFARSFQQVMGSSVVGCFIGTNASGTAAGPGNVRGIAITSSTARENVIGRPIPADRNLISGNSVGIYVSGAYSIGNIIQNNYIGTDRSGTAEVLNGGGIELLGAQQTVVGGATPGAGNVILGGAEPAISDRSGESGGRAIIQGNMIGCGATGMKALGSSGVVLGSGKTQLGGSTAGARNVLSTQGRTAIEIRGFENRVEGNYIGVNATGEAALAGSELAVLFQGGFSDTVGGYFPEQRNVIVAAHGAVEFQNTGVWNSVIGNYIGTNAAGSKVLPVGGSDGIGVLSDGANGALISRNVIAGWNVGVKLLAAAGSSRGGSGIEDNFIGTDQSGTFALPNATGIQISNPPGARVTSGGIARNVISGNGTGISITGADNSTITGNWIGVAADGVSQLGNSNNGVEIADGSSNSVGGISEEMPNTIAYNGGAGVAITGKSDGNPILRNSIFSNGGLGIDLGSDGVSTTDSGDKDRGPNGFLNTPIISAASRGDGNITIVGHLQNAPNTTYRVEFFASASADVSGFGEGAQFLGARKVKTGQNGNANFNVKLPVAFNSGAITATATGPANSTSEFSAAFRDRLYNLSTRLSVGTDERVMIAGFIVRGADPKKVLIRGLGPSLRDEGVNGVLEDPMLSLQGNGISLVNNDWRESQESEVQATGIPPAEDSEAAIVATLPPGAYTATLAGRDDAVGVGLVEVYDLSSAQTAGSGSELANISTRGFVQNGAGAMIGGLIIGGIEGGTTADVLVRGLGPSLSGAGLDGALQNPMLELYDGSGSKIYSNNDWRDSDEARITATGIPPDDSRESAILASLPPGAYTTLLRGENEGEGIGLIEIYHLD